MNGVGALVQESQTWMDRIWRTYGTDNIVIQACIFSEEFWIQADH